MGLPKKLQGKHHQYCEFTYRKWIKDIDKSFSWTCICNILGEYDEWMKKQKNS